MKIVPIFADKLFSIHYDGEEVNELDRLLSLWNNVLEVFEFVKQNISDAPKNKSIKELSEQIIENAVEIDNTLNELSQNNNRNLDDFFKPLNNQEYRIIELSKQKGRKNYLRIYALRIDTNCYVITGGAIKFHHYMDARQHTANELIKIEKCRNYLKENNVINMDSFYEFLNEDI